MKKLITLLLLMSVTILSAKTLVTVNGHKITDSLLAKGYEKLNDTQKSNLMEQLIKEELIYANLLSTSIVNNEEFLQAFNQQRNLVEQQYGKTLNEEQLRSIKGAIAVSLYQQGEFQKSTVTNAQSEGFYQNNTDKFTFPDSIEIANIIVQDEATANSILTSLQASTDLNTDFIQAANTQKQKGYMGWFGRDSMPKNLFDRAYKYKVQRLINTPVKTKHGYNVVYLLNKKVAGKLSYGEAKPKIEQMLKQQKVMEKLRTKVENLYGLAQIIY